MIDRRGLLASFGAVGGTVLLAGCSGSGEPDDTSAEADAESESGSDTGSDTEPDSDAETASDTEPDSDAETASETEDGQPLGDISIGEIKLSYGFSNGLHAKVDLSNEAEEGTTSVFTKIEAFGGENSLGSDSTWADIAAGFSSQTDMTIESIGSLSEHEIDDVTEFVISGRLKGGETVEIESLTGEALRDRVDA